MGLSGILGTALNATSNPNPNSLTTKNPYPTPYVNYKTVSYAWITQGVNALFPRQSANGQGLVPIPVEFVPSTPGATFIATIWQYNKLSNTWFPHATNPTINYTGETGNLVVNIYTNLPIFIQLSTISAGTVTIYFDNGVADLGTFPLLSKMLNVNNIFTKYLSGGAGGNTGGGNTQTFTEISNAPDEFDEVRVIFKNIQATSFNVASLIVAPTASNTDKIVPTVGNNLTNDGGLTGWQTATFGGNTTGTVPAKGATARDGGTLYSDWIKCKSVRRSDGNVKAFIMARARFDTTPNANSIGYYTVSLPSNDASQNYYQEAFFQNGDFTTSPSTLTTAGTSTVSPFFGFEFRSSTAPKIVIKMLGIGNSVTQGIGGTPDINSWANRLEELARAQGQIWNVINAGSSGAKTDEYIGFGKPEIATIKPTFALISAFSPNNAGTPVQADFDTMYAQWIDVANYCIANGTIPVAVFLAPNNNYNSVTDALRKAYIAKIKAGNFPVLDLTGSVGDGALPERYKSGLNTDLIHPNDKGYDAQALSAFAQLLDIVRRYL